jgi:hypothetical protein
MRKLVTGVAAGGADANRCTFSIFPRSRNITLGGIIAGHLYPVLIIEIRLAGIAGIELRLYRMENQQKK